MVLSPPPVPALVNLDDRTRMRLTSSRHKLTVARGRKAAGTALSHERLGMRDALRVVRRS